MISTNDKQRRYPDFSWLWRSLLSKFLYVIVAIFISIQITLLVTPAVQAVPLELFENPPELKPHKELTEPLTLQSSPGRGTQKEFDLTVQYTKGELYNPATKSKDKVRLRSYVGTYTSQVGRIQQMGENMRMKKKDEIIVPSFLKKVP